MGQLIDKTVLRKELSKLPSEMGFVRKSDVMQILGSQKCAYNIKEERNKTLDEIVNQIDEFQDSLSGGEYDYFPEDDIKEWLKNKKRIT